MRRSALMITIVAIASLGLAVPVFAAAPTGDLYVDRTVVGALPFTDSVDTTEATTDADDAEAASQCGSPPTDASVWYEYTATSDAGFTVDTNGSTYSTGIIVVTGSPGSFSLVACFAGSDVVQSTSAQTYSILRFDYQGDGGGNGGILNLPIGEIPPAPVLSV